MMPHSYCIGSHALIWAHVAGDMSIFVAYVVISACLMYYRATALVFRPGWVTLAFAMFIFSCGLTHLMDVVVIWEPVYRVQAAVKAMCAVSSLTTAAAMPKAISGVMAYARVGGEIGRDA